MILNDSTLKKTYLLIFVASDLLNKLYHTCEYLISPHFRNYYSHKIPQLSLTFFTCECFVWVCASLSKQGIQKEHFLIRHGCSASTTVINSQKTTWIQNACLCVCDKQILLCILISLFFEISQIKNKGYSTVDYDFISIFEPRMQNTFPLHLL